MWVQKEIRLKPRARGFHLITAELLGNSLNIQIADGRPRLGTWQGIYLCEHRNHGGNRRVVVTIQGE